MVWSRLNDSMECAIIESMTCELIIWRDAAMTGADQDVEHKQLGLITLVEVGFVINEDDESVSLSCEHPGTAAASRLTLTIPHVNIIARMQLDYVRAIRSELRRSKNPHLKEWLDDHGE